MSPKERIPNVSEELFSEFFLSLKKEWDDLRPIKHNEKDKPIPGTEYDHFKDVYDELELKRDQREVEELKKKFTEKAPIAVIGEYIIMHGIWDFQWISEEVEVIPTHEFDDIKRGTDFVMRFEDENNTSFYLGVDVTTAADQIVIRDKRKKINRYLNKGDLEHLKYFEDQDSIVNGEIKPIKGELEVPKVIIIFDPKEAERILFILERMKKRSKLSVKERENLIPEEKAIIEEEKQELKGIQEKIENEFISQLEEISKRAKNKLEQQIESDKVVGETHLVKKYRNIFQSYEKVYDKLKKEA